MELSQQTQIEAQIGFLAGTLVGVIGAGVSILFFTNIAWYFKLFSAIGEIGIIGTILLGLYTAIQQRRALLAAMAEMKELKGGIQWKKKN